LGQLGEEFMDFAFDQEVTVLAQVVFLDSNSAKPATAAFTGTFFERTLCRKPAASFECAPM
jgi:hypothetical protein